MEMNNAVATPVGDVVFDLGCNATGDGSLDDSTLEQLFILAIFPT